MTDPELDLDAAVKAAREAFDGAGDLDALAAVKPAHLGDKAPVLLARRSLGSLPGKERAEAGKRVNAAWTEGGVTWTNQPATTGTAVTAVTPSGSGTMTWNVTSMVQAMAAGTNHGFLLRDASTTGDAEQGFHAREKAPDQPPRLVVTFGPAS